MSKKNNLGLLADPPEHVERPRFAQKGNRNNSNPGQRNGETSSSPESLNGDGNCASKSRRRRKRTSNPETGPNVKVNRTKSEEESPSSKSCLSSPGLAELQSECANVWFERSMYERAESLYQCWLANTSVVTFPTPTASTSNASSNSSNATAAPSSPSTCHHSDHVACHHICQSVWVNKNDFDQAECHFVESSHPPVPNSLNILPSPNPAVLSRTPDEGYQSLAPTPATPVVPQEAVTPTRQSINGLPRVPVELLRDVWLEKPQYDRAEAAFYQNQCSNNSSKRSPCPSTSRSSDHPQSLVEEEEDEEEAAVEERRVVAQCKAEVFHALHPIQEEEEPTETSDKEEAPASGVCYFLHPDSERLWLDKSRYDAAEIRFYSNHNEEAIVSKRRVRPDTDGSPVTPNASPRDKTMSALDFLAKEKIWFDKPRYDDAERRFYERMNGISSTSQSTGDVGANSILKDIARARENIQKSLAGMKNALSRPDPSHEKFVSAILVCDKSMKSVCSFLELTTRTPSTNSNNAADQSEIISRIKSLEHENESLYKVVEDLRAALSKLECRVTVLEKSPAPATPAATVPVPYTNGTVKEQKSSTPNVEDDEDDDDDVNLFGSDEDEEEDQLKQQRLKEYAERKAKKPAIIAKSSILLDVKPWDDETDMVKLEECVRTVQMDGLLWGSSKLVPVGYGIKKLQIACVVEDDKVGTDLLEEEITKFEDFVQSVDVAAFNKI